MSHYYDKYSRNEIVNIIKITQSWVDKNPTKEYKEMLRKAKSCLEQFDKGESITKFDL